MSIASCGLCPPRPRRARPPPPRPPPPPPPPKAERRRRRRRTPSRRRRRRRRPSRRRPRRHCRRRRRRRIRSRRRRRRRRRIRSPPPPPPPPPNTEAAAAAAASSPCLRAPLPPLASAALHLCHRRRHSPRATEPPPRPPPRASAAATEDAARRRRRRRLADAAAAPHVLARVDIYAAGPLRDLVRSPAARASTSSPPPRICAPCTFIHASPLRARAPLLEGIGIHHGPPRQPRSPAGRVEAADVAAPMPHTLCLAEHNVLQAQLSETPVDSKVPLSCVRRHVPTKLRLTYVTSALFPLPRAVRAVGPAADPVAAHALLRHGHQLPERRPGALRGGTSTRRRRPRRWWTRSSRL